MENASRQPSRTGIRFGTASGLHRRFILLVVFALFAGRSAPAAVVALTDAKGNTAITIQPKDTFQVVLSVADVKDMAGFQVLLGVQGPVSLVGMPTVGTWFAEDHKYDTYGNESTPFIAILTEPSEISGTGELAVFTFLANGDGVATVSIPKDGLIIADREAAVAECESYGDFTIAVGNGKAQEVPTPPGQTGEVTLSSGQSASGGGMLLTVDCCNPPFSYPCTGFMQKDPVRDTGTPTINMLDLLTVRNALNQTRDDGHFATRNGTASDLDENAVVNVLDEIVISNNFNKHCADMQSIQVVQVVFTLKDDNGDPIGDPQILGDVQTWDTPYWELDHSFYLTADVNLEILTTLDAPIAAKDFELRWVQLVDDGQGNPVRPPTEERPAFEIENDTSRTGSEFFTYNSEHTITLKQIINGSVVASGDLGTLTMETFVYTGSADPATLMIDGPTICIHQRPHLIAATAELADPGQGFCEGDALFLAFDQPTNQYGIDNDNIERVLELPNSHEWGSVETIWQTSQLVQITFGEGIHTAAVGDKIGIAQDTGGETIMDDDEHWDAIGSPPAISLQVPHLIAATAQMADPGQGFQEGDALFLTFNQPTNQYDDDIAEVLVLPDPHLWGSITSTWLTSEQLKITLDDGASTVALGDELVIAEDAYGNTIMDAGENFAAIGSPPAISLQPHLVSAVADIHGEASIGFCTDDKLILTFDAPTNGYAIGNASIDRVLGLPAGHQWTVDWDKQENGYGGIGASWTTADRLEISFRAGSHTVAVGDWITIGGETEEGEDTIMDEAQGYVAIGSPPIIKPQPHMIYAQALPMAGPIYGIQTGDIIRITFNFATNHYDIPLDDLDSVLQLKDPNDETMHWGTIASATWSRGNQSDSRLDIVLSGTGGSEVLPEYEISVLAGKIKDASGRVDASDYPIAIEGTFGEPPQLISVYATDAGDHAPGVQDGDQIVLVFDAPTNGYDFSAEGNFPLADVLELNDGSLSWGNATAAWSTISWPNDCLIVTLADGNPAYDPNAITISIAEGYEDIIQSSDPANLIDVTPFRAQITGDCGPVPTMISAVAADTHAVRQAGIQSGDEIVITFNNATNQPVIDSSNVDGILPLPNGTWGGFSATWSTTVWPYDTLHIVFTGEGSDLDIGYEITIAQVSGLIKDPTGAYYALGPVLITGDFGAAPMVISAEATNDGCDKTGIQSGDKLILTFDKPTNEFAITTSNIDSVLCVIGKAWESVLDAQWNEVGDVCTITFEALEQYSTGTVRLEQGVATVELKHGGTWPDWAAYGHLVIDAQEYEVFQRTDETHIELEDEWAGGSVEDHVYVIEWQKSCSDPPGDGDYEVREGDFIHLLSGDIKEYEEYPAEPRYPAWGDPVVITGSFGSPPKLLTATANANGSSLGGGQDDDQVVLVFDESTNGFAGIDTATIDTVLPITRSGESVPWGSIASAGWSNSDKTLTITLGDGTHEVAEGDLITVVSGYIKDVAGNEAIGSATIDGSFGAGPVIVSALAVDASHAGYGNNEEDIVIITFDRATNGSEVEIDETNINNVLHLDSHSWGTINGVEWTTTNYENDTLIVRLGSDSPSIAVDDTITINFTGTVMIMDADGSCPAGGQVSVEGSFGEAPVLLYGTAYPAGSRTSGIQLGDIVVLRFDQSVSPYSGDLAAALTLESQQQQQHFWGDFTFEWSTTVFENDTLTITFDGTGSPSVAIGDSITIEEGTIQDDTEMIDATSSAELAGTFGGAPQLVSAWALPTGDTISGIQDGDQVTLVFDSSCDPYEFSYDDEDENYIGNVLLLPEGVTWGQPDLAEWSTTAYADDTVTITLTTTANVGVGNSVTIASGKIHAANEQLDATGAQEIGGSFGLPTTIVSVVAQAAGSTLPGIQAPDCVVITFDEPTNGIIIDATNIDAALHIEGKTWGEHVDAAWSLDKKTLTVSFTTGTNATVEVWDVIEIGGDTIENDSTINTDDAENRNHVPVAGSFGGSPRLISAVADTTNGSPARGVQGGDQVVLTFDTSTNAPDIDSDNIDRVLKLIGPHTWGPVAATWSTQSLTNDTLTIVFVGTGTRSIEVGDVIEISVDVDSIWDETETYCAISEACVSGTFGGQPKLLYAILYDASDLGNGIQDGDQAILAFDLPTNCYEITSDNIDSVLTLNGQHSWGTIDEPAEWSDNYDVLTITFGTGDHDVAVGNYITIGDDTITGLDGDPALGSPPAIGGATGGKAPMLISAEAFDTSGLGPGIQEGDTVVLTFDSSLYPDEVITEYIDYQLHIDWKTWSTITAEWSTTVYTNDTLTVTFEEGGSPTVAVGDYMTNPYGVITGTDRSLAAVFSPPAITGSFGDDTEPP
ncbi:MAG TPA: hypothetical protein VM118_12650, partial [Acidobacteriota bacterium]|nr:hypothetical protein [Acidobacteriota bacterium]